MIHIVFNEADVEVLQKKIFIKRAKQLSVQDFAQLSFEMK